jgi:hypothetical protein
MCISAPKVKAPPPPAQFQAMQVPKDMTTPGKGSLRRRGMWASIFTGPQGIVSAPNVTGTSGGVTGG